MIKMVYNSMNAIWNISIGCTTISLIQIPFITVENHVEILIQSNFAR
ncbi:MAG: hypothetical protein ACYDAJ_03670 [Nitrosotalea sp.]